eukprot:TRINITY_DN802_c0_g1_i13.p3 TRINITY_DN802_c0_g1~~TRINITY_DN802_c0_g1_i13.p3  ORF type:complete len:221 (+),score=108.92 TRINITY_DN802_c0_g1_i13:70-732(+)
MGSCSSADLGGARSIGGGIAGAAGAPSIPDLKCVPGVEQIKEYEGMIKDAMKHKAPADALKALGGKYTESGGDAKHEDALKQSEDKLGGAQDAIEKELGDKSVESQLDENFASQEDVVKAREEYEKACGELPEPMQKDAKAKFKDAVKGAVDKAVGEVYKQVLGNLLKSGQAKNFVEGMDKVDAAQAAGEDAAAKVTAPIDEAQAVVDGANKDMDAGRQD